MTKFRWGIFGTGAISAKFIAGLAHARDAEAVFVASRSIETARSFAGQANIAKAVGGYSQAVDAEGVDAIYIATPPALHADHAMMCIEAGIPVLIEKPIASSAAAAMAIRDAARRRSVFAMEAMWTRFLPAARALHSKLAAGAIGEVRMVVGSFATSQIPDISNGMFSTELGGGALAHLAAYPLSLAQWLFGSPLSVQAIATIGSTGAEEDCAFHLRYANNVLGSFVASSRSWAPDDFSVLGTHGMLSFRGSIVRPYGLYATREAPVGRDVAQFDWKSRLRQNGTVHRIAQRLGRSTRRRGALFNHHYSGNGYHYEADEVRNCVERGQNESTIMPLDDSVAVASTSDTIYAQIARLQGEQP